jgi:hypothetical protein
MGNIHCAPAWMFGITAAKNISSSRLDLPLPSVGGIWLWTIFVGFFWKQPEPIWKISYILFRSASVPIGQHLLTIRGQRSKAAFLEELR